jgi:preprotein translocase subunit YajC
MLDGASSSLLQIVPFVLILGIFYFIILLPTRRKQQKVQEFLDQIAKINGDRISLQIADKVRIDVSRAAIGGYQGQPPVVEQSS